MAQFTFRGLMAPTFTAFNSDFSVNQKVIGPYAKFLSEKHLKGVLINGTTGEGPSMNVEERKAVTETWNSVASQYSLELMVQIGGAPYPDVVELAKHAQAIGIKSVLCLPELYFKPKTEEALVDYLASIAKHCPQVAILYYHIPVFTGVNLSMPRFCDLARQKISNFAGIKYTSGDLEKIAPAVDSQDAIFIGSDTILCGALSMGFNSSIMTTLNICPELAQGVQCAENPDEARRWQTELNKRVADITLNGTRDWVPSMKSEFNKLFPELHQGAVRL